ncbi:MAG: hypothetical protein DRJ03_01465 [Chloroflexi bacterium]|nr:MAG: hypothetical protein DRJ03_01465 [Chloroflexota bacterium]
METKKWYASKTFWFAILFGLVHVAGLFGFADYTPSSDVAEIVNVVGAVIILILRLVTNKAIEL